MKNQKTKIGLSLQKLMSFPMRYFSTEPYYVTKRAHEHLVKVWGGATSSFVKFKILPPGENMTRVILQNNEPEIRILVILIVSFGN